MAEAFARCQGEAEAAFGDRAVFLEKIVPRPRHIEVQVLGDGQGNVVHLFERDCSVQLRNQKVVEVAPAPNLDAGLRQRILADAVKLARAARYENAGTVEFLVYPESGEHFFIECNPRIQVEHTITEQVMGVDLVEAQFRIAAGASLGALGLADQKAVGTPRGFAVQARIVAQGTGTLSAYSEPSGPGVRVDACGYLGLRAAAAVRSAAGQADLPVRLLGHVRVRRRSHPARARRIPHRRRADERRPAARDPGASRVPRRQRADDAARRGRSSPRRRKPGTLQFLDQQAASLARGRGASAPPARPLPVPDGHEAVESPHAGSIVDIKAREGAEVKAGDMLFVVSAMKMETSVTAPCAGTVATMASLSVGDAVDGGQMLAVIKPAAGRRQGRCGALSGGRRLGADARQGRARCRRIAHKRASRRARRDPGVVRQRNRRKLTCRERIDAAARCRQLPRGRQPGRLRDVRRRRRRRGVHAGKPRRRPGPHRGPRQHRLRRRLHVARRPRRRRDRPEVALSRPALHRVAHALDAPAGRLVGWRQRRRDGAAAARSRARARRRKAPARSRPAGRAWSAAAVRFCPATSAANVRRAARHRAGREHAARQRGRHRRGQGGARATSR